MSRLVKSTLLFQVSVRKIYIDHQHSRQIELYCEMGESDRLSQLLPKAENDVENLKARLLKRSVKKL